MGMSERIRDFFTGDRDHDRLDRHYRLYFFHNATSLVGLLAAVLLFPVNALTGHDAVAAALVLVAAAALHNLYAVRRQDRIERAGFITLATLLPLFAILVIDGGVEGSGPYWLGLYPLMTFFVAGLRRGLLWNAVFLVILLGLSALKAIGMPHIVPTTVQLLLMTAAYLFFAVFCAVYEYFRGATDEALRRSHESLRQLAMYDVLTSLPNRAQLYDRLNTLLERAQRYGHHFAVLFIDLDGFKTINDDMGHVEGDNVLQIVATRLRGLTRQSDIVARHGGDEFVLILEEITGVKVAVEVARRCISELERPLTLGMRSLKLGASIGIALYPQHGQNADTLIMAADTAMYEAKRAGRNTWQVAANAGE